MANNSTAHNQGTGVGSHDATANWAIFVSANAWMSVSQALTIQFSQWAPSIQCAVEATMLQVLPHTVGVGRPGQWCGWGPIYSSSVLTHGEFSALPWVDVLRATPCGDWWPFGCIWALILASAQRKWVQSHENGKAVGSLVSLASTIIHGQMSCGCWSLVSYDDGDRGL